MRSEAKRDIIDTAIETSFPHFFQHTIIRWSWSLYFSYSSIQLIKIEIVTISDCLLVGEFESTSKPIIGSTDKSDSSLLFNLHQFRPVW